MIDLDALDAKIVLALDDDPDTALLTVARQLGVSRNTVNARLRRMEASGLFLGFSQRLSLAVLGHPLLAFMSLEIAQDHGDRATAGLAEIPEVVEVHATTGDADLLVMIAAKDADDLYRVTNEILDIPGITRSSTAISLSQRMPRRTRALVERIAQGG
ncbi:Lrp/AsnC family transcriptional regulator [Nocardioides ultimimeridianus]